jgi:hypothetical protein
MTKEEKIVYDIMVLHAGKGLKDCPLSHLKPKDVWVWIDKMNELLKDTSFCYTLTGDKGVTVLRK